MRTNRFVPAALLRLILGIFVCTLPVVPILAAGDSPSQISGERTFSPNEARIEFWNRLIAFQRGTLAGITAQARAEHADERLQSLPLNATSADITLRAIKVENQEGIAFVAKGQVLFFLATNDLDKASGETLDQASQSALRRLSEALQARVAERSWPVIRAALLFTVIGFALLLFLNFLIWKIDRRALAFLRAQEFAYPAGLRLFGFDWLPYITAVLRGLVRSIAWVFALILFYLWVTLSLRRFPYTEPWGDEAGNYVIHLLQTLARSVVFAIPGLFAVFLIFFLTRWIVRLAQGFFEQISTGRISVSWMDADVAHATQRIVATIAWIFAIIVAYPYIPGSNSDAFKGISVFVGLVVSLGSTGIINQIMSGLFVVYSKALKTGEWVKINETEGEVLEVGLLAAKIRTIEGQEVTIPHSVLVGTSTTNFTRLGMVISRTVTIGYDAPWRQVHALLLRAADRTPNIRKQPEPYVVQRGLSDFYVEYTLIAQLEDERRRIESISVLNSQIQDAFNEFGVQIMSPHYMVKPDADMIVPPAKWHAPPSNPKP